MANMLRRVCHFVAALAMACSMGGLQAQANPAVSAQPGQPTSPSADVANKEKADHRVQMQARLVSVDKELRELQKELNALEAESRMYQPLVSPVEEERERQEVARKRIKELETSKPKDPEIGKLKKLIEQIDESLKSRELQGNKLTANLAKWEQVDAKMSALDREKAWLRSKLERLR